MKAATVKTVSAVSTLLLTNEPSPVQSDKTAQTNEAECPIIEPKETAGNCEHLWTRASGDDDNKEAVSQPREDVGQMDTLSLPRKKKRDAQKLKKRASNVYGTLKLYYNCA